MKTCTRGARLRSLRLLLRLLTVAAFVLATAQAGLAWGPEGHKTIVILAARYLTPQTMHQVRDMLGSESLEDAAIEADQLSHGARTDTALWHYIDIPLAESKIDLGRDCPKGQCVLVKVQEFISVLGNPHADRPARREALLFVLHFVGDLHQPLHCEDHNDKGGNAQQVIFEGHPDNLHWVWDTGLVQKINRDPRGLATQLARRITERDRAAWEQGSVQDWVLESHRLAQTVAYRRSWGAGAATLDQAYDRRAEAVIEVQIEKASVRLAHVLNQSLGGHGAS